MSPSQDGPFSGSGKVDFSSLGPPERVAFYVWVEQMFQGPDGQVKPVRAGIWLAPLFPSEEASARDLARDLRNRFVGHAALRIAPKVQSDLSKKLTPPMLDDVSKIIVAQNIAERLYKDGKIEVPGDGENNPDRTVPDFFRYSDVELLTAASVEARLIGVAASAVLEATLMFAFGEVIGDEEEEPDQGEGSRAGSETSTQP